MKSVQEIEKELAGIEDELMDVDYRKPKNQIQTLIDRKRSLEKDLERLLSTPPGIADVSPSSSTREASGAPCAPGKNPTF